MVEKTMTEVLSSLQKHRIRLEQIYNESREENSGALSWNQIKHLKNCRNSIDEMIMIAVSIQENPDYFTDEEKESITKQMIDIEVSIKDLMKDINKAYAVGLETIEERRIMTISNLLYYLYLIFTVISCRMIMSEKLGLAMLWGLSATFAYIKSDEIITGNNIRKMIRYILSTCLISFGVLTLHPITLINSIRLVGIFIIVNLCNKKYKNSIKDKE